MREEKERGRKEIEKHNTTKTTAVIYSSRSARFILVLLSSTLLVVMFSETMLLPAIPEVMQDFKIPYRYCSLDFQCISHCSCCYDTYCR